MRARVCGLSFEGGAWLWAQGRNKEGTLFTCIARQSKLASGGGSKYKAQNQTYREGDEGKRGKNQQKYQINPTSVCSLRPLSSLNLVLCDENDNNPGWCEYRASNCSGWPDFIVFVFNMLLCGRG